MPGIVRKGIDTVSGGLLLTGSPDVFIEGVPACRIGDAVDSHGSHYNVTMVQGDPNVIINGIPACAAGHMASCGHSATGSPNVIIG